MRFGLHSHDRFASAMYTTIAMQVEMGCHLMMLFVLLLHVRPYDHGGQRLLHGLCI